MAKVDAFEPEKRVLPKLKANLALNNLRNVTVHEWCVAQFSGKIGFRLPDSANEGTGGITSDDDGVEYSCISLNDFFKNGIAEPTFIKMDIEGGEWLALQGADRVLKTRVGPVSLLIEIHPQEIRRLGGSLPELKCFLMGMGFSVQALTPSGMKPLDSPGDYRFWWVE